MANLEPTLLRNDGPLGWNPAALSAVVCLAQPLGPLWIVAVNASSPLAVAAIVMVVICLCLAQDEVRDSIVYFIAVDVVDHLALRQRPADMVLHYEAMHQKRAPLSSDNQIAHSIYGSLSAAPSWMVLPGGLSLLGELTLFRTRRRIGLELTRAAGDRRSTNCAWFGDLGHATIVAQLQEV